MGLQVTNITFGLQAGTDRTLYAQWSFSYVRPEKNSTKKNAAQVQAVGSYTVLWEYHTNQGIWFEGNRSDIGYANPAQSTYNAPSNATKVRFRVKPNSNSWKGKKSKVYYYFTGASFSAEKIYDFTTATPPKPSAPSVEVNELKLTVSTTNYETGVSKVQFHILQGEGTFSQPQVNLQNFRASLTANVNAGYSYRARQRAYRGTSWSEWSEYSSIVDTRPANIGTFKDPVGVAGDKTAVQLEWSPSSTATSYEIEYATKQEYFDYTDQTQTKDTQTKVTKFIISQLDLGVTWFFRVRAKNDKGVSGWSAIKSIVLGEKPGAPTTWSLVTSVTQGDDIVLYWTHNASDGSKLVESVLEYFINGVAQPTITIPNTRADDDTETINEYTLKTDVDFTEGANIKWHIKTRGILPEYSDWSIDREINVYAPPTLIMTMHDQTGLENHVASFPITIGLEAGPPSQNVLGYQLVITSGESYQTTRYDGEMMWVGEGQEVFNRVYDVNDRNYAIELSASDIDLENGVTYQMVCKSIMSSGLSAEAEIDFGVSWEEARYYLDAEIAINDEDVSASIRPYCVDEEYNDVDANVLFNIYRRDFDGNLTLIAKDIDPANTESVYDPHPSLDGARYRIVAIDRSTGAVSFEDLSGMDIDVADIILQWNETWTNLMGEREDDPQSTAEWAGSMIRLPYNIDVSDTYKSDTTMVSYIGRSYPVSYYGTQKQSTATWNVEIEADDFDTLYSIRRLAVWQGDVYVREPSGSGYWANVEVSFSQKHRELTIPVTFNITRVDGGM